MTSHRLPIVASEGTKLIQRVVLPLLGRPAWEVKKGHGSFLTFEFGDPHLVIHDMQPRSPPRRIVLVKGDWHLWIYCCAWTIVNRGDELAHNEASDDAIRNATRLLNGQRLERVALRPGTAVTTFEFDLGGQLTTWPYEDEDPTMEQWYLYEPVGKVLSVRADARFAYEDADCDPNEERWRPIWSERQSL